MLMFVLLDMQISGVTATIFGCSGFLGRYITNYLARAGSQCVIPHRADEVNVQYLKQMGDLGMVGTTPTHDYLAMCTS